LLNNQSPFEKLFHQVPDYKFLKVFGCACFPNLRPYNTHKFSQCSKECVFLGYSQHHKGYKCPHIEYGRVYISRYVIFHVSRFPYASKGSATPPNSTLVQAPIFPPILLPPPTPSSPQPPAPPPSSSNSAEPHGSCSSSYEETPPARIHPMHTRSMNNIVKPRQVTDGTVRYPAPRGLLTQHASTTQELTCFSNAVSIPEWRNAMQLEFNAPLHNQTWSLVPPHSSQNPVGCK